MKIKKATAEKYAYLLSLTRADEPRPIEREKNDANGQTALACFHVLESTGERLPCREPELLERYLSGKKTHGITVGMAAEDLAFNGLTTREEIGKCFPAWVAAESVAAARRAFVARNGFTPKFLK